MKKLNQYEKATVIINGLDKYLSINFNFLELYQKAIVNAFKEIERIENGGEIDYCLKCSYEKIDCECEQEH